MTHEPGRERHTTHKCEHCGCTAREDELTLTDEDEYWCEGCIEDTDDFDHNATMQSIDPLGQGK